MNFDLPDDLAKLKADVDAFVRAEVIPFDALKAAGSWQEAHKAGTIRTEGRDYVVQDGDVVLVRFHT